MKSAAKKKRRRAPSIAANSLNRDRALTIINRQGSQRLSIRFVTQVLRRLLEECLGKSSYDLSLYFLSPSEIAELNEKFLRHAGPTDVISFDYSDSAQADQLIGEIFVCVEEAISQATRFSVTWQEELFRYVIHGVLHLSGYDDRNPSLRRKMKRSENHLLRLLHCRFDFDKLSPK